MDVKIEGGCNSTIQGTVTGKGVVINLSDLETILKLKKATRKSIELIFGDREKLNIKKINSINFGVIKKSLIYLNADIEEMSMESLELIDYPNKVSISGKLMSDMFYESSNYSDVCEIETNENGIYFREQGAQGGYEAYYRYEDLEAFDCSSSQKGSYAYTFLNTIKKFLDIMDKDDNITIYNKTAHPIKIVAYIKSIDTSVTFYIAPRCEEAEDDDDDDDEDEF